METKFMNLFREVKALFAVRSTGEEIYKEATQMTGTTPGYKTTEFWLNLATQAATLWGAVSGFIPPKYAAIISTAGIAVYTVARTILKAVTDIKTAQSGASVTPTTATATVTTN
jgi:hypothetical protein